MAITDPKDTLAYHLSRPLSVARDMSGVPVEKVAKQIELFLTKDLAKTTQPESEALWFYLLNHGMAHVRKEKALYEPLGDLNKFVGEYYDRLSPKAIRAFYYLMLICTREARHLHATPGLDQQIIKKFGHEAWNWTKASMGEQQVQAKLFNSPPNMPMGLYTGALCHVFYHGKWSSGYGGPAWGAVTDCLHRFVVGEFNAEMMLDTVWTLAHNHGPIFNKGQMYGSYTSAIYQILDVQAAGLIHEYVLHEKSDGFVQVEMRAIVKWISDRFGTVGPYVDWYLVEALGSKHKYEAEKMAQTKQHGMSQHASQAQKMMEAKLKAALEKAAAAKAKEDASWFHVMPGLKVPKYERKKAA